MHMQAISMNLLSPHMSMLESTDWLVLWLANIKC